MVQNLNFKLLIDCLVCCPSNKVVKSDTISCLAPGGLVYTKTSYAKLYKHTRYIMPSLAVCFRYVYVSMWMIHPKRLLCRGYTKFDLTVNEGEERLNPSRDEKLQDKPRRKKAEKKKEKNSVVTFLLCDPVWCVHILTERCSLTSRINRMT